MKKIFEFIKKTLHRHYWQERAERVSCARCKEDIPLWIEINRRLVFNPKLFTIHWEKQSKRFLEVEKI